MGGSEEKDECAVKSEVSMACWHRGYGSIIGDEEASSAVGGNGDPYETNNDLDEV